MKKLIPILVCATALCAGTRSHCQVTQEWAKGYNGPGNGIDIAFSLARDSQGNVFVSGNSPGATSANDITTIKYNSVGQRQWVQRYNGPGNGDDGTNGTNAIGIDNAGNIYVTGWSLGQENTDFVTIKYDTNGIQQWARRYNGPGNAYDAPYGIAVDAAGSVHVAGGSEGNGSGSDYTVIKYDTAGARQWVRRYNGPGNGFDNAQALTVDQAGNVCVTGYSTGISGLADCVTIKYDAAGNPQWARTYDGAANGTDYGTSIASDAAGNIYVTGGSAGTVTNQDYVTIKYNSLGRMHWASTYSSLGANYDEGRSLGVDGSGNVYVTGVLAFSEGGTSDNFGTIKYNSSGVEQWVETYDGPNQTADEAFSIAVDQDGNSYVVGYGHGLTSGSDLTTIKYNTDGAQQWLATYNSPANSTDTGFDVGLDSEGNVYVSGSRTGADASLDYVLVKYSQ
jgi:uncharacterized delta-60 repeat protein